MESRAPDRSGGRPRSVAALLLLAPVLLSAPVLVAGGCSDATSPAELAGVFPLERVDGEPPPSVVASAVTDGGRRTLEVLAGSVEIRPTGPVLIGVVGVETVTADGSSSTDSGNDTATGELVGGDIVLAEDTIRVADRPFGIAGTAVSGDVVTVTLERTAEPLAAEVRLRYER